MPRKFVGLDDSLCPQLRHVVDLASVRLPLDTLAFSSLCVAKGWEQLNERVVFEAADRKRKREDASPAMKRNASSVSLATRDPSEGVAAEALAGMCG